MARRFAVSRCEPRCLLSLCPMQAPQHFSCFLYGSWGATLVIVCSLLQVQEISVHYETHTMPWTDWPRSHRRGTAVSGSETSVNARYHGPVKTGFRDLDLAGVIRSVMAGQRRLTRIAGSWHVEFEDRAARQDQNGSMPSRASGKPRETLGISTPRGPLL